ncbi:MAG: hypothetical protein IPP82_11055 [Xanthomonadales bacterium]|nr:hypothetical protein [Xanthomonadales bacterium]
MKLSWNTMLFMLAMAFAATCHAQPLPYPVLFVTQFPITDDFTAIGSVFGNHRGNIDLVGRGGDLYIRYPDGSLRNLTSQAGYGNAGQQGAGSIAVRDPAVSWDGTKAVFSMVIGAPTQQYQQLQSWFQLYEVSGLGQGQTAVITKVPNQPLDRNNVSPVYLSDGSLLFVSDIPRNGAAHLYPQLDEYEEAPTPTGLWHLQPATGQLELLQNSVSGSFNPIVDSFGRILFTRWDHLQRDQQNDDSGNSYGTFNYSGEGTTSVPTPDRSEAFPEPRETVPGSGVEGFTINHFFPWMINQDGSGEETLNHVGRHELHSYFDRSFNNDPALVEFIPPPRNNILNMLQLREDPTMPGRYIGIDAPEFYTHSGGQIIRIDAPPSRNPATMSADYLNPRSNTGFYQGTAGDPVPADFTGHFRNPLPLTDGRMIAAHTSESRRAGNDGTRANPDPRYDFRLKRLAAGTGGYLVPVENLTSGISKSVSYWDPDVLVSYNGPFWELSPVEVRPHTVPPVTQMTLQAPELNAFTLESVDPAQMRTYLRANGLALVVMRNVTTRDRADKQQPFNLRVPGGTQTTASGGGLLYDIADMQFFQGDQIRGVGGTASPGQGRRVLAQILHDGPTMIANLPNPGGPAGSVPIAADGSVALFLPARRALAWHSTNPVGTPVVRERYWISFQPGEIRACDGCHGVNQDNQATPPSPPAQNTSTALRELLARWRNHQIDLIFSNGLESR